MICTCPACNSSQSRIECFLGNMGVLRWFRCRYCGIMWSKTRKINRYGSKKKTSKA